MAEVKKTQWSIDRLLKPNTRIDLILDVDLINDRIDVRNGTVYEISEKLLVLSQTDPLMTRSMVGREVEVTFVGREPVSGEVMRWGWSAKIVSISDYKFSPTETVQAIYLSAPKAGEINETNARMDYRLTIVSNDHISIQTHPSFGRVVLFDFSAGGVLIGVPAPPQATLGMRLWFTLFFPNFQTSGGQTTINGEAEVVRINYAAGDKMAKLGLKFHELDLNATRALQKAINYYMLEEQRARFRSES
ncbi:MAG: PilZ domain-containing protein [Deltaproteobacteria bacterium]|jgi:c-di-GMP-binding flagellar brake protein YcgR|nr:PilZ domain-containing protein [Deltaproteobacteria bacterium]